MNDAVSHNGSAYIAVSASANEAPGSGTSWDLLASKGDPGPAGTGGGGGGLLETYIVAYARSLGNAIVVDSRNQLEQIALCDAGDVVLSGGYETYQRDEITIRTSEPYIGPDGSQGWRVVVDSGGRPFAARALCADTAP